MMTIQRKALLAALASTALLAGCATGPYYDDYRYGSGYNYGSNYGYGTPYYGPAYVAPSAGVGLGYYERDYPNRDRRYYRDRPIDRADSVVRPGEYRDSYGEVRDSQGRTAADRDRAANSASGG